MMFSRFTSVAPSFLRVNNTPLYGLTALYSLVSGHSVCLHVTIVNNAIMIMGVWMWHLRCRDVNTSKARGGVESGLNAGSLAPDPVF